MQLNTDSVHVYVLILQPVMEEVFRSFTTVKVLLLQEYSYQYCIENVTNRSKRNQENVLQVCRVKNTYYIVILYHQAIERWRDDVFW